MRDNYRKTFLVAAASLLIFSAAAWARDHHELDGTWKLLPTRSELNGEPPFASGTVTINDYNGKIYLMQHFSLGDSTDFSSAGFTLEGHYNDVIRSRAGFWGVVSWEEDTLHVKTTENGDTTVERFTIEPDGILMMSFQRPGHQTIRLYFQRS